MGDIGRTAAAAAFGAQWAQPLGRRMAQRLALGVYRLDAKQTTSCGGVSLLRACLFEKKTQHLATGIGPLSIGVGTRRLST
jgi:hypothetical protein